jgi:hypothetical protein
LDDPQGHQQDRGHESDLLVGRQQADADGRQAHEHEGSDDSVLSSELVTEMTEDNAAERTGNEADGEGREGRQCAHRWADVGEEEMPEDERRGGAVDVEVEPLDGGADESGDTSSAALLGVDGSRRRGGSWGSGRSSRSRLDRR